MRKIATGLTSVPISDVPGNENVEVKYFKPEDAQTANTSGFNQVDTSSFSDDEILEDEKKFNLKNIVSNKMKNKIKEVLGIDINKVSSAYIKRELLKLSQSISRNEDFRNEDFMKLLNRCIDELNNDIISKSTEYDVILNYPQWLSKLENVYSDNTRSMQGSPNLDGEQIVSIFRAENKSPEVKAVLQAGHDFYIKQINDKYNKKLESGSAAGATGVNKYVGSNNWGSYLISDGRHATIKNLWEKYSPGKPDFDSYKKWWKETYRSGGGSTMDVIEDLKREISLNKLDKYDRSPVGNKGYGFGPSDIIRTPLSTTSEYRNGFRKKAVLAGGVAAVPLGILGASSAAGIAAGLFYNRYYKNTTEIVDKIVEQKSSFVKKDLSGRIKITLLQGHVNKIEEIIDIIAKFHTSDAKTNIIHKVFYDFLEANNEYLSKYNYSRDEAMNYYNSMMAKYIKEKLSTSETSTSAPVANTSSATSTRRKSTVVNDWNSYILLNNKHGEIKRLWYIKFPQNTDFNSYKQWWKDKYSTSGGGDADQVIGDLTTLKPGENTDAAGSTGATTPPPQAPTPAAQTPTPTGPMISSVTVNERPAVAIGTAGKDLIVLTIESLNTDTPELYRKDNKTGTVKKMTPGENMQFRNSLSNVELNAIARELGRAGVSPGKISGFLEYMKLQRRENRFGPLFRDKRKEKMNKARQRMNQQNIP